LDQDDIGRQVTTDQKAKIISKKEGFGPLFVLQCGNKII
jgi:hypothetical protein